MGQIIPWANLEDAIRFATEAHAGQWRDGDFPLPYLTHPLEVLGNLRYLGGIEDEDVLVAGVLHDVLEETEVTEHALRDRFGKKVAKIVVAVTRSEPTSEETQGLSKGEIWALRSERLLDEIRQMPPDAHRIKLADRISNLQAKQRTFKPKKLERYLGQTRTMLEIIPPATNLALWTRLHDLVDG